MVYRVKFFPKKKWGQCFIADKVVLEKIYQQLEVVGEYVIEIGPGNGELTDFLVEKSKFVWGYEIDPDLVAILNNKYIQKTNVEIQNCDFLQVNLTNDFKKVVVGSIPYYITSEILFKLFKNANYIKKFFCVLQDEVALRLTAKVNSKNYGKLSVVAQFFAKCVYGFKIENTSFVPSPKVNSAFIKMYFKELDTSINIKKFLYLIEKVFSSPRKKLSNNLKLLLSLESINHLYRFLELPKNLRPQELSVNQYINIYNFLLSKNYI